MQFNKNDRKPSINNGAIEPELRGNLYNRREMLKMGSIGAVIGPALAFMNVNNAVAGTVDQATDKMILRQQDVFPHKISKDYKRYDQKDHVFSVAFFRNHPELGPKAKTFFRNEFRDTPGFTQLDHALGVGGMQAVSETTGPSPFGTPAVGLHHWEQRMGIKGKRHPLDGDFVEEHKYKFKSKTEAADAIKRAAVLYGASLVGIARHDPRWDYKSFLNPFMPGENKEMGWDKFPFKPKTVIVMAFEMNYEAVSTAPTYVSEAAYGDGYSQMAKTAYQLSIFMKQLGYKSVASGNDLGLTIPYAIAAGLGELGRMGNLVTYKYGPRIRLAKVYTEFDLVEYDKPISFGVREFCKRCMRCADACPGKAISTNAEPSMAPDFDTTWKGKGFENTSYSNPGVEKWYLNAKKCFEYWVVANNGCGSCITACPYNKPNFWHHRMVDKLNALMPGPVHSLMREMDIIFGYGNTFDEKSVKKFWSSRGRNYQGY